MTCYNQNHLKKINELKSKIKWSCLFSKPKYQIIEGCLRIVEHTNLEYVEPHKVIVNNRLYLFFNDQDYFYIGNLKEIDKINIKANEKDIVR